MTGHRWVAALALVAACLAGCDSGGGTHPTVAPHSSTASSSPAHGTVAKLPLALPTLGAQQVITVVAGVANASTATLQAWVQRPDKSWLRHGPRIVAHIGAGGLSAHEREGTTSTPMGSYTLTQAFGRLPNPGTRLPYVQTTPDTWWISQPGPLYNTMQSCVAHCTFRPGQPNARLFYVTPQYDFAVVIDYNRRPVVQGAGSGIFLHVTSGRPTNGCISIAAQQLVPIMRWLDPAKHPRILIGVGDPSRA